MYQLKAEILENEKVAPDTHRIRLFSEKIAPKAKPGQFIHIRCGKNRSYLLRRPMSIHRVTGRGVFEILFKVVGEGTGFLSQEKVHSLVDIVGPLGKGFEIAKDMETATVVAGGIGIAPLMYLIDELLKQKVKVHTLLGAQSRRSLLYMMDLKRSTRKVYVATDDGSTGHQGPVTELLPDAIELSESQQVFACGPFEMLKKVSEICIKEEVGCQVSLESQMACGVGACMGCVVKTKDTKGDSYLRVCADGPVFDSEQVIWK